MATRRYRDATYLQDRDIAVFGHYVSKRKSSSSAELNRAELYWLKEIQGHKVALKAAKYLIKIYCCQTAEGLLKLAEGAYTCSLCFELTLQPTSCFLPPRFHRNMQALFAHSHISV